VDNHALIAPMAPPTAVCYACGKGGGRLFGCSRCQKAIFCNCDCQAFARAELGHRGANCRAVDGVPPDAAAVARASVALDRANLIRTVSSLSEGARAHVLANTRIGYLAAAEKLKEAASVADLSSAARLAPGCALIRTTFCPNAMSTWATWPLRRIPLRPRCMRRVFWATGRFLLLPLPIAGLWRSWSRPK